MRNKTGRHNKNYQKRMFTKADWPGFCRVLIGEVLAHVHGLLSQLALCEFLLQIFFAVTNFSRFSVFRNLQNSDWNLITIFGILIRYNQEKTGLYFWCNFYTFFLPVKYYKPTHTIIQQWASHSGKAYYSSFSRNSRWNMWGEIQALLASIHDANLTRTVSVCDGASTGKVWAS